MRKLILPATLMALAGLISACTDSTETLTDPDGLVTFDVPEGWTVRTRSNGVRLARIAPEQERSVLFVKATETGAGRTLDQIRDTRLSQIRSQNSEFAIDNKGSVNGFATWESLATAPAGSTRPWMHSIHLLSDDLHVEVGLIAIAERHEAYVDDLNAVVNSIETR